MTMPVQMPPVLSGDDLARFTGLVRQASGIEVPEVRRTDLELAVAQALAATGLADTEALYTLLAQERGRPALETMVEAMTIGETYFFRNRPQFEALTAHILPELIERRRASRQLRLWSAGCATGEEAYSLAILLEGLLPDLERWQVLILATDINRLALAKARRGLYGQWSFREVPPDVHQNFFLPAGRQYEIVPRLRERVTFAYLNLVEDTYPSLLNSTHTMDLILFRNVLIYFREATARRVVGRLHAALANGGWLVVGHADASPGVFDQFRLHNFPGTVVYQKTTGDVGAPPAAQVAPKVDWWSAAQAAAVAQTAAPQAASPAALPRPPARAGSTEWTAVAGRPAAAALPPGMATLPPGMATMPSGMATLPASDPYRAALELWQRDQPDEALRLLKSVATAEPRGPRAPYLAAKIQANRQQLPEAETLVAEALRRDPLLAPAHYLLGLILQETGRTAAALDALRRCVYSDPQFVLGHFALANLFLRNGQPERAHKSLDNVVVWLADRPRDELVAEGDGLTAGRLTELIAAHKAEGAEA